MIKVTRPKYDSMKDVITFPKLMIRLVNGGIVLVNKQDGNYLSGTVLYVGNLIFVDAFGETIKVGYHSKNWIASEFIDYTLPITLENE